MPGNRKDYNITGDQTLNKVDREIDFISTIKQADDIQVDINVDFGNDFDQDSFYDDLLNDGYIVTDIIVEDVIIPCSHCMDVGEECSLDVVCKSNSCINDICVVNETVETDDVNDGDKDNSAFTITGYRYLPYYMVVYLVVLILSMITYYIH